MKICIVTPSFNEEKNFPVLAAELIPVTEQSGTAWVWLNLDDHSRDDAFAYAKQQLGQRNYRIRCVRMAKNYESHTLPLFFCFQQVRVISALPLSADLQNSPAQITQPIKEARPGANIVWLTRATQADPSLKKLLAKAYYFTLKHFLRIKELPLGGTDMVLVDKLVLKEPAHLQGPHSNFLTAIAQPGYQQCHMPDERRAQRHQRSDLTLLKKIKLLFETITVHSRAPMRWMTALGLLTVFVGLICTAHEIISKLRRLPEGGGTSLLLAMLLAVGVQTLILGVHGKYLRRTWEAVRNRPQNLVGDKLEQLGRL